ncbi:hypothetical protein [Rhizohabitans arisaemae]|uniref:hypothetical protein n=1 Tax=Rhizohabitans arisaemae TaxID=2720610 RepID=UPI0024B1F970|nr:hypothetical protein [Rhizohabitans arisaemae]
MVRRLAAVAMLAAVCAVSAPVAAQAASYEDVLYSPLTVGGSFCVSKYGPSYVAGAYESVFFYCYGPKVRADEREACQYMAPGRYVISARPGIGGALVCRLAV